MSRNPKDQGYIDVAERISAFRERYPDGSLRPLNFDKPYEIVEIGGDRFIVVVAAAFRSQDDKAPGVGMASEPFPGKTPYTKDSELMNAETSAWGRAIVATLAADTNRGIASAQEVRNRSAVRQEPEILQLPEVTEDQVEGFETALACAESMSRIEGIREQALKAGSYSEVLAARLKIAIVQAKRRVNEESEVPAVLVPLDATPIEVAA